MPQLKRKRSWGMGSKEKVVGGVGRAVEVVAWFVAGFVHGLFPNVLG